MSGWRGLMVLLVAGGAVALGLHYRDRIVAVPHPATPPVLAKPDVLYTWVDRAGVTHFEQESGQGRRLEYDGSRITPLAPADPAQLAAADAATAADNKARAAAASGPGRSEPTHGSQLLQQAAAELRQNALKIQAAREDL
jgi:hypothetical protein